MTTPFTTHLCCTVVLNPDPSLLTAFLDPVTMTRAEVSLRTNPTFYDPTVLSDLNALQLALHTASILLCTFTACTTDIPSEDQLDLHATSSGALCGITRHNTKEDTPAWVDLV
jgi:hypothetical protein